MKNIKIKLKNEYNNFIGKIIEHFDTSDFEWNIIDDEVYNKLGNYFFENNKYSDNNFKKKLKTEDYYIVAIKIIGKNSKGYYIIITISDSVFVNIKSNMKQFIANKNIYSDDNLINM